MSAKKGVFAGVGSFISKAWKRYSFIFVFAIILLVYSFTIEANGNAFKWGHITVILAS